MNAVKTLYKELPENITIPKEFVNKKAELIILIEDVKHTKRRKKLSDFSGAIPDFPDRYPQGEHDNREHL